MVRDFYMYFYRKESTHVPAIMPNLIQFSSEMIKQMSIMYKYVHP